MKTRIKTIINVPFFCFVWLASVSFTASAVDKQPDVSLYQYSWTHSALSLQREMDLTVPLSQSTFLGTHNSYNSLRYQTFFSYWDPNQLRSIYDQFRMDVRFVELDLHWYFSIFGFHFRPILCHGQNNHLGCSLFDRPMEAGLDEINTWLSEPANKKEVLMIYLEEHVDQHYDEAIVLLTSRFSNSIYRPHNTCEGVPMEISKQDILNSGKNILLVSSGCKSTNWNSWVYAGVGNHLNGFPESNPKNLKGYPNCGYPEFTQENYANLMIRYYEDSTFLTRTFADPGLPLTADVMRDLQRCGVNLTGMDKLFPADGRLAAAVWSWDVAYPVNDNQRLCAFHAENNRIRNDNCAVLRPVACRTPTHDWVVSSEKVAWTDAETACAALGAEFASPVNGYDNEQLAERKSGMSATNVWINYSNNTGWKNNSAWH